MATKYFDSSLSTGLNDGSSWPNAWQTLAAISPSAGDIVEMSGGPNGGTQTLNTSTWWAPTGGSAGNVVMYRIGQDSSHNGTLIFNLTGTATSWVTGASYVWLSGDAGDGQQHFRLTGNYNTASDNVNHVRYSYLEVTTITTGQIFTINGSGCEIDHCNLKSTDMTNGQSVIQLGTTDTSYDQTLIHHNTILSPYNNSNGFGADLISGGNGVSVYNNILQGYSAAYTSGQHQDGWQINGGNYIKFYANTLIDVTNYAFFGEAFFAGFTHMRIYDNLCLRQVITGGGGGGIIVGINAQYAGTTPCVMDDIIIANNCVVDYTTNPSTTAGVSCNNDFGVSATFSNTYVVNNLLINGATSIDTTGNTGGTYAGNVFISSATAASYFTTYTANGVGNNYHLIAGATLAIHAGTNMQGVFTYTDKDSVTWANPPSVGVYEYVGSGGGSTTSTKRICRYLRLWGPAN